MRRFHANKFYIIVSDSYDNIIKDIYDSIIKVRSGEQGLQSEYLQVNSEEEFQQAFSKIEEEVKNGILPYIHIEAHGYMRDEGEGGLELISGEKIDWNDLATLFTETNLACQNNLFVSLASCWGENFKNFIFDNFNKGKKPRSPVYGFIGPKKEITYDELKGFYGYFETLVLERDVNKAYEQLIYNARDKDAYILKTSEQIFKEVVDDYLRTILRPRFKSKETYKRYLNEQAEIYLRDYDKALNPQELRILYNIHISEQTFVEFINKLRDDYIMIDLYKENDKMWDKIGSIENWDKMVEHLK